MRRKRQRRCGSGGPRAGDCGRGAAGSPARGCERTWGRAQCPLARVWGVRCAPRLRVSGSPGPSVRGSLPPVCCSPQPPPRSPGTKRLRGGAEPAALARASRDGRAPSSDSPSQPPIRPQETESPCLASSHLLPSDRRSSRSPTHSVTRAPTLPSAAYRLLSTWAAQERVKTLSSGVCAQEFRLQRGDALRGYSRGRGAPWGSEWGGGRFRSAG